MSDIDLINLFRWGMKRNVVPVKSPLSRGGNILHLGAGNSIMAWPLDWSRRVVDMDWPAWDANHEGLLMYADESVDGIFAFHFLEHLEEPIGFLRECQRVLRPGAPMTIVVPYYSAQIMAHDLTHRHAFCEDTWKVLFDNPFYDKDHDGWRFNIGTNVIMGIVERNLSLFTQLIKRA